MSDEPDEIPDDPNDDAQQNAEPDDDDADRQRAVMAALTAAVMQNTIPIYKAADLAAAIRELEGDDDDEFLGSGDEKPVRAAPDLASEDCNRLRHLKKIARGPLGPRRRLLVGSDRMLERVEAVKATAPHFARFIDLVARSVGLSMATGTPLRLPPVLLVGEPGIGKTFVLKRMAEALDTGFELFPMNMLDSFRLRGLNTAWKGARIGRIAETLLKSPTASPVILLDEFEKAPVLTWADRPYDIFHSLFEEENSEAFTDDFLELPLRADHVLWIASANSVSGLPDPIVDRLLVLEIPSPTRDQLLRIVDGIYADLRERYDDHFADGLADDARDLLARHNPRQLKRIIAIAFGFASADGRDALDIRDVERAIDVTGEIACRSTFRHAVGFTGGS